MSDDLFDDYSIDDGLADIGPIETLDFNDDGDIETLDFDDGGDIETLDFDDDGDIETLDFDDSGDIERLDFDDSGDIETLDFDDGGDIERLDFDDSGDIETLDFNDGGDEDIETLDFNDDGNVETLDFDDGEDIGTQEVVDDSNTGIQLSDFENSDNGLQDYDFNNVSEGYEDSVSEIPEEPQYTDDSYYPESYNQEIPTDIGDYVDFEQGLGDGYEDLINDIRNDESLTPEQQDAMIQQAINDMPNSDGTNYFDSEVDDSDPVKVLTRDPEELISAGNDAINDRLYAQEQQYISDGLSDSEIQDRLAQDRIDFQNEFLQDAFPDQDVSPDVFNNLGTESQETFDIPEPYYTQGNNEFGLDGTCGPTSVANSLNQLGLGNFTENDTLSYAMQNDLCSDSGGTVTENIVDIINGMGTDAHADVMDFENAPNLDSLAHLLENPNSVAMVGVDSATIWDENGFTDSGLFNFGSNSGPSDHWITVTNPVYENGQLQGFDVIDSGGGVDYLDAKTFQDAYMGSDSRTITDPTAIIISK